MQNFYCPVFLKTIHIVLKIFLAFLIYIYIYIYNSTYLYLYTSLASIIFHGTPRSALSYYDINSKTYKATMVPHLYCMLPHYFGMVLHYYDTTLSWLCTIMMPH
jgi:hypothetical protein